MSASMIHVVSGLAIRHNQVFMGLRRSTKLRPDLWELPGGKVDGTERPEAALEREWREELGIEVKAGELVAAAQFELEIPFVVMLYRVRAPDSLWEHAKTLDHVHLRWVEPSFAAKHMPCSPAFYVHYPAIARTLLGE